MNYKIYPTAIGGHFTQIVLMSSHLDIPHMNISRPTPPSKNSQQPREHQCLSPHIPLPEKWNSPLATSINQSSPFLDHGRGEPWDSWHTGAQAGRRGINGSPQGEGDWDTGQRHRPQRGWEDPTVQWCVQAIRRTRRSANQDGDHFMVYLWLLLLLRSYSSAPHCFSPHHKPDGAFSAASTWSGLDPKLQTLALQTARNAAVSNSSMSCHFMLIIILIYFNSAGKKYEHLYTREYAKKKKKIKKDICMSALIKMNFFLFQSKLYLLYKLIKYNWLQLNQCGAHKMNEINVGCLRMRWYKFQNQLVIRLGLVAGMKVLSIAQ